MEPTYMIPAFLRELIDELSNPNVTEETRGFYIEDVRRRFNETAMELSMEDIENLIGYIENLIGDVTHSIEFLSNLRVEMPEDPFEKIEDPEKNFIHHVLHDQQKKIAELLGMMNIDLEVLNIGKDELTDYLPVKFEPKSDEKGLKKTPEDIDV
ncbi:MAG: hypothetical protein K2L98_04215 [Bacilli bacterium]|nr:hypothetical protein [Bacilli bacterium]